MKAQEVINHILNLPQYRRAKEQTLATKALKEFLGKAKAPLVRYAYLRDNTLFVCVKAPFAAQELKHDSNIISIKNFLNMYFASKNLGFLRIENVKFFVAKNKPPKIVVRKSVLVLKEKAKGNFKLRCKNPKLAQIFLDLREILRQKVKNQA